MRRLCRASELFATEVMSGVSALQGKAGLILMKQSQCLRPILQSFVSFYSRILKHVSAAKLKL